MTIINQLTSFKLSGITFTGTSQQLNYTAGVTSGSVIANKAVVIDTNRDLIGTDTTTRIRNLTLSGALNAVTITGVIQTSSQPNITSLGNLTNLNITNNLNLLNHNSIDTGLMLNGNIVLTSAHELNYNRVTPGTAAANKTMVLDGSRMINNVHAITLEHIYTNNMYIEGILVTASASELNYLDIISIGQGQASKAMVLDSSRNINNINTLTVNTLNATTVSISNLSGTIQTPAQPNITSLGTLTGLTLSGSISGVSTLSTNNITLNGTSITSSATEINRLTGVTTTPTQFNFLAGVTAGTSIANKCLVVDANRDIININSMTLNGLNDVITIQNNSPTANTDIKFINDLRSWELGSRGSASTPSNSFYLYDTNANSNRLIVYPTGNIDIVAHNSSTIGLMLGGSLVTSSASELNILKGVTANATQINYLTGVVPGTATSTKAMVLDSSLDISGIDNIASNSITLGNQTTNLSLRFISALDSVQTIGSTEFISFGRSNTDRNSVDLGFLYSGLSSDLNQFSIGFSTVGRRLVIQAGGNTGINTTSPDRQLEINAQSGNCLRLSNNAPTGSAINFSDITVSNTGQLTFSPSSNNATNDAGDILLRGSLIIGKDASNNLIRFNGVTGDIGTNMTVIGERLYNSSDFSELILFKGNDSNPAAGGPDRIRYRSAEHRFQTFTATEIYSSLSDNNTRLIIMNDGKIGINSTNPDRQLEINSSTGDCLRLTFNDSDGSAATFSDLSLASNGNLRIKTNSNTVFIGDSTNTNQRLTIGADLSTASNGSLSLVTSGGICYIQPGINTTTGSSADLVLSNYAQAINASSRKIIFKNDGKVGFGTVSPNKTLELNSTTGDCLRLTFNNSDGNPTNFSDLSVSSTGNLIFNSVGTAPGFTFTGGNVAATLSTASQPNITSLGILTSLTMSGAVTGITNLTMSGTLSGASSIIATSFTGLLATANQSNITDLGILNGLRITNNLKLGTTGSSAEDMIHLETVSNSFIGIQIENRNTTAETSGCKLSFMGYRDTNSAYEVTRIASVTTTSEAPTLYQYGALAFYTRNHFLDSSVTERMRIINTGFIGINTTNPTERLHVNGNILASGTINSNSTITATGNITGNNFGTTGSGRMTINASDLGYSHKSATGTVKSELVTYSNGTITGIGSYNSFPFVLYVNDTERMRVATNGNVGIRTTNPLGFLDFGANASDNTIILYQDGTNAFKLGANDNAIKYQSAGSNGHIWFTNSSVLSAGTERMRLNSSGFLGIGTISPSSPLTVQRTNNNPYIRWTDGTTIAETYINSSGIPSLGSSTDQGFGFYTNNGSSNQLFLEPSVSKNVGIGTNTPTFKLDVSGIGRYNGTISEMLTITSSSTESMIALNPIGTSGRKYWLGSSATGSGVTAGSFFIFDPTANASRFTINSNGNIGLGTNNPGRRLDVNGEIYSNTKLVCNTLGFQMALTDGNIELVSYINNAVRAGAAYFGTTGNHDLAFQTNGTQRMTVFKDGKVGINTTAPAYLFDVNGTTKVSQLLLGTSSDTTRLISALKSDMAVNDNVFFTLGRSNDTGNQAEIRFSYAGSNNGNNRFGLGFHGGDKMYILNNGSVYRSDGLSNFGATSDRRLKDNIVDADLNLCYDNIKRLRLVHYTWKDYVYQTTDFDKDKNRLGWIAQEVETIFPNAVVQTENFGLKDCKTINVDQIYTTLYGCTRKLILDKENLENENILLNNKVNELEEVVTNLYDKVESLTNIINELKELMK